VDYKCCCVLKPYIPSISYPANLACISETGNFGQWDEAPRPSFLLWLSQIQL